AGQQKRDTQVRARDHIRCNLRWLCGGLESERRESPRQQLDDADSAQNDGQPPTPPRQSPQAYSADDESEIRGNRKRCEWRRPSGEKRAYDEQRAQPEEDNQANSKYPNLQEWLHSLTRVMPPNNARKLRRRAVPSTNAILPARTGAASFARVLGGRRTQAFTKQPRHETGRQNCG